MTKKKQQPEYEMSASRFQKYMTCPAAALAYVQGKYIEPQTEAMLLGQYYGVALETPDLLDKWVSDHAEAIYRKNALPDPDGKTEKQKAGVMLKSFDDATRIIAQVRKDKEFMQCIEGVPEEPIYFDLDGVKWIARPDMVHADTSTLIDLKRVGQPRGHFDERLHKFCAWYDGALGTSRWLQLAIYRWAYESRYGDWPANVALAAITGDWPAGREIVNFSDARRFNAEMMCVAKCQEYFIKVQRGEVEPRPGPVTYVIERDEILLSDFCRCDWCRGGPMIEIRAESAVY